MLSFRAISALLILGSVAGAQGERYVLGQVSETLKPTRIYASPSTHCRSYYRVSAYYKLVTNPGPNGFAKVMLSNWKSGYVAEAAIAQLPYKAVVDLPEHRSPASFSRSGDDIARYGLEFRGSPYKMGGTDPNTGIDCSAFVQKLYGDIAQVKLPRTAAEQALVGTPIYRYEDLQPGDRLYFWDKSRNKIGHAGVYIGGGFFVHSSHGHGGVATDYLTKNWQRILVSARRGG